MRTPVPSSSVTENASSLTVKPIQLRRSRRRLSTVSSVAWNLYSRMPQASRQRYGGNGLREAQQLPHPAQQCRGQAFGIANDDVARGAKHVRQVIRTVAV